MKEIFWTKSQIIEFLQNEKLDKYYYLQRFDKKITQQQRKYHFGYVIKTVANFRWISPEQQHEEFKKVMMIESINELTSSEYSEIITQYSWHIFNDYWITIYLPNENELIWKNF